MGCECSWAPTKVSREAGTDRGVKSLNHRVADMQLGSHLSTGFAILEEGNDKLLGGGGHVYWGGK